MEHRNADCNDAGADHACKKPADESDDSHGMHLLPPRHLTGAVYRDTYASIPQLMPGVHRHSQSGIVFEVLLLIDNYDSFTFNLVHYLGELGADVVVRRNDVLSVGEALALEPDAILLSPGPCDPDKAGICLELTRRAADCGIPVGGVCLGHQVIGQAFGGRVVQCHEIMHGKLDTMHHSGCSWFGGLPSPLRATRYHSLVVERASLPDDLEVTSWLEDGTIMGIRHRSLPIHGIQFHPESIATEHGHAMLENFLRAIPGRRNRKPGGTFMSLGLKPYIARAVEGPAVARRGRGRIRDHHGRRRDRGADGRVPHDPPDPRRERERIRSRGRRHAHEMPARARTGGRHGHRRNGRRRPLDAQHLDGGGTCRRGNRRRRRPSTATATFRQDPERRTRSLLAASTSWSNPGVVEAALDSAGIGFMMAPMHHPAVRHVMPVRQELGARTIFNILGPLTNPAGVKRQLTGAYSRDIIRPMAETLAALGSEKAWLVHGDDGTDEISISGPTSVVALENGIITEFRIEPGDAGLETHPFEDIVGGSPEENAAALRALLAGEPGAYRDSVLFNAAAALVVAGRADDLASGVRAAAESVDSGAAARKLDALVRATRDHSA